jgi:hypothetical protein
MPAQTAQTSQLVDSSVQIWKHGKQIIRDLYF